jgi:putative membrane protein
MLLAAGVYPNFINAIAELTTLRFKFRSLLTLGCVVLSASVAIILLAGTVKELVVEHRWIMYSLFIGLTLGGVPVVWRMIGHPTGRMWAGAVCGFVAMALLALGQQRQLGAGGAGASGPVMLFLAGVAGASAMILPGVSGGYLLLVLGQYVPILSAIDQFKDALQEGALDAALGIGLQVALPVGLGVVVGIVAVSNLLRVLLRRCRAPTLGFLLGLLLGAVVGLWPFQQGVEPAVGDTVKGEVLTEETLAELEAEDYPTAFFKPGGKQVGGAMGMLVIGFAATFVVARLGGAKEEADDAAEAGTE